MQPSAMLAIALPSKACKTIFGIEEAGLDRIAALVYCLDIDIACIQHFGNRRNCARAAKTARNHCTHDDQLLADASSIFDTVLAAFT